MRKSSVSALTGASLSLVFILCSSAGAQVTVGAGSGWSLGDATVDWGCSDVAVDGALDVQAATASNADSVLVSAGGLVSGGSGTLGLTGDFANSGTFSKGTGTVAIRDGCGNTTSTITGNQSFRALSVTTTTGKTLLFTAGATTSVSPGPLTLQGTAGNLLKIRSTIPGTQAYLNLAGNQNIHHVDVADNRGTGLVLAPGPAAASSSVNSGNVFNWFDSIAIVPTLSVFGLLLLCVGVGVFGATRRRTRSTPTTLSA